MTATELKALRSALPAALLLFTLIGGLSIASAAWSAQSQCRTDRDCAHLRGASCGKGGLCVSSPCSQVKCAAGTFCVEKSGRAACVDPCSSNPCQNGGTCQGKGPNEAICSNCDAGWTGKFCDKDVNECGSSSSPCVHGVCSNTPGSYACSCQQGWTGTS